MATESNAFSGATMSNAQAGTRLTSSSDWTRLKKLQALGRGGWNNKDSNSTPFAETAYNKSMLIPKHAGASKYQGMASDWTNFRAYNTTDYVFQSQQAKNIGKNLVVQKLCSCSVPYSPLKRGPCVKCNGTLNKR